MSATDHRRAAITPIEGRELAKCLNFQSASPGITCAGSRCFHGTDDAAIDVPGCAPGGVATGWCRIPCRALRSGRKTLWASTSSSPNHHVDSLKPASLLVWKRDGRGRPVIFVLQLYWQTAYKHSSDKVVKECLQIFAIRLRFSQLEVTDLTAAGARLSPFS